MFRVLASLATAALACVAIGGGSAAAADLLVAKGLDDPCGERRALVKIQQNFDYQVKHVPNLPNVGIAEFYNLRQTTFLPEAPKRPIPRLYCAGNVRLTNGEVRNIWYLVEYGQGFAGIGRHLGFAEPLQRNLSNRLDGEAGNVFDRATYGLIDNVEACVAGFDRWYVYDYACRVLREGEYRD